MDSEVYYFKNFEEHVYELISKCLGVDETIIVDAHFDFVVPNGVKKLGWEKETYIEVKYRLTSSYLTKVRWIYDEVSPQKLIIIVIDKNDIPEFFSFDGNVLQGRSIIFETYDVLYNRALSLIKDSKITKEEVIGQYQKEERNRNLDKAKIAIKNNRISLFLGAGVSKSAGSVNWEELLNELCKVRGLNIENKGKIISDIQKGRYILEDYRGEQNVFCEDLRKILYEGIKQGRKEEKKQKLIKSIASLVTNTQVNLESVITFNYDDLLEQEITLNPQKYKKGCISIYQESVTVDRNNIFIYHVHGYLSEKEGKQPECIILGEKEYHQVYRDSFNWSNVEQLHARSTCFFIGLSMTDPNLRRLMDISYKESDKDCEHFVFLKKDEYNITYMENTMRRFGVNCIWYDEHDDLPGLLDGLIERN